MKVLMSAYACEPNRGSEPGVGWNWALQAARFHEVWVVTRANNRDIIEAELAKNPVPNLHFTYHDLPKWARWWKKGGRGLHLYYYLWQLTLIPKLRSLHRKKQFDLTHQVTFVSNRFPSPLAWIDAPFIWGPIAGGEKAPRAFYSSFGQKGLAHELLRDLSNVLAAFDPLVRYTMRRASAIVSVTEDTLRWLPHAQRQKASIIPAMGMVIDQAIEQSAREPADDKRFELVYVGNFLHLKGLQYAIRAVAIAVAKGIDTRLALVGSGPFKVDLTQIVSEFDVSDRIKFSGQLTHHEVFEILAGADAMIFPSLHDSGGFAVLEAMQVSLPVICFDLGGPAMSVTSETGFKITAISPDQAVKDLALAIEKLASDPVMRQRMGTAGRQRVKDEFSWDRKGELIRALYAGIVEHD